jgi:hypothetical protein
MPPINLANRRAPEHDFRLVGVTWFVKDPGVPFKSIDPTTDPAIQKFYTLPQLQAAIAGGVVKPGSQLSHDLVVWINISDIYDLEYLFQEVWDKAMWQRSWSGEARLRYEIGECNDFDEDCPTRLGSDLMHSRVNIIDPEHPRRNSARSAWRTETPSLRRRLGRIPERALIMLYPVSVAILGMALYLIN